MIFNLKMQETINNIDRIILTNKYNDEPNKLLIEADFIFPPVVEMEGVFLINRYNTHSFNRLDCDLQTKTKIEWDINDIYLSENDPDLLIWKALKIVKSLKYTLEENFPDKKFCILMSHQNDDVDVNVVIRFWCIRSGVVSMVDLNLENYTEPCLLEFT